MPNLIEVKPSERWHGLIYSESGRGKTHLIGQFPKPYILDFDGNLETLYGQDVQYDSFYERASDDGSGKLWPKVLDKLDAWIEEPWGETLAIDSLTTALDVIVAYVVRRAGRTKLELQDYVSIYDEAIKFLRRCRKAPTHLIVNAHEDVMRDEETGKLAIRPWVLGQELPKKVPIFFNNVYNIVLDGRGTAMRRKLLVVPDGTRVAKSQATNDDVMIDKTFEAIIAHINKRS